MTLDQAKAELTSLKTQLQHATANKNDHAKSQAEAQIPIVEAYIKELENGAQVSEEE